MRRTRAAATTAAATACLATCLALAACGGASRPVLPVDEALQLALASGTQATALSRLAEAARDYRDAYARALTDDDQAAIGVAGTDLAIVLTADAQPDAALREIATTRADLGHRRADPPPELALAEAAALLRLGRAEAAADQAASAEAAFDPAVAARAAFLRGLAADALGDRALLAASLARLERPGTLSPTGLADRAELLARLDRASGRPAAALAASLDAVRLRRVALDIRGLGRVLRLAALLAHAEGDDDLAADLAVRAGQTGASRRPSSS